ncbi:hypothetical protein U14_02530 [Candidatus Moduliflexus flocculans]|uniref:TsaA-like domain-containing protein n=1 Tax=Candidatus Moduliflexus flocculans TaxID=1499966 RepID=A0A081BLM1_9BACT|nr:hypothetical protein U14_02530 [Candidatus Moduliflexus flocculans]
MNNTTFTLQQIGTIQQEDDMSYIQFTPTYRGAALRELEYFSHAHVVWWCHFLDTPEHRAITECEHPYTKGPEKIGVFATRSPRRPNPIAITVAPVVKIDHEAGRMYLAFIDAAPGSPVVDVKPYHPLDRVRKASVPEWCRHWPEWYEDCATFDWVAEIPN